MADARHQMKDDTVLLDCFDHLELIEMIEGSFGVQIGDGHDWSTVGDIYEALLARVSPTSTAGLCATSMAFYRVRQALAKICRVQERVTPKTKLAQITHIPPKRLYAALAEDLGLRVPMPLVISWRAGLGLVAVVFALSGFPVAEQFHLLWAVVTICFAVWMFRSEVGMYAGMTVGELARRVANANVSHFTALGADMRPAATWNALCAMIAEATEIDASSLTMNTRLVG